MKAHIKGEIENCFLPLVFPSGIIVPVIDDGTNFDTTLNTWV